MNVQRISENVLFSLLVAVVVGWSAVTVAADASMPVASGASCAVAGVTPGSRHS